MDQDPSSVAVGSEVSEDKADTAATPSPGKDMCFNNLKFAFK